MESLDQEAYNCSTCRSRLESSFANLSDEEIQNLNQSKHCRAYKKGDLIFQEGSLPKGLFCVFSGKIKVAQLGDDGKEQIVHLINDGDIMGHRAILGNDAYSCSAVAVEDSHICFVPKDAFYNMLETNAKLTLKVAHLLSDELKELELKVTHSVHNKVKDRVALSLLQLLEEYGLDRDSKCLNISLTREELANIAGTSRETATRILYDFKNKGIIELVGKKIRIQDQKSLEKIAHGDTP